MDVQFLGSFMAQSLPPAVYPEIAIAGRSNVGKSSFINSLLGRRSMARVSSKPGKTRTINFYLYRESAVLVDLPGYGYSRAPRHEQKRWARDVELYLTDRKTLKGVVLLGDLRHFPTDSDTQALDWFVTLDVPLLVVLTKADKLRAQMLGLRQADISGTLGRKPLECILFSAKTGLGRKEVWSWIEKAVSL